MKRMLAVLLALVLSLPVTMSFAEAPQVITFGEAQGQEQNVTPDEATEETAETSDETADTDEIVEVDPDAVPARVFDEFVIGVTTKLSGMFFTNMWGNNTADIDVRSLIHGYSPVVWTQQSLFEINPMVVQGVTIGEYEDGNKVYLISLHDDLKYNDGTQITAQDYVFSLMMFANPIIHELGGITTNSSHIRGYEEYLSGESEEFRGLRIVDDLNFSIEIKAEYLPFFYELGMLDAIPYPVSVIAPGCEVVDEGKGAKIQNIDKTITEPIFTKELLEETIMDPDTGYLSHPEITSGPYKLTEFDWETRIAKFQINEHFKGLYDGAKPTIDNLVLTSVIPETMIEDYETEEVQLLNKVVAGENIDAGLELYAEGTANSANYARLGFGFISFTCEEGPFQFEAVRQAVGYSIDEESYCRTFSQYSLPVYGYMGIGQWMYLYIAGEGTPTFAESEEDIAAWSALSLEGLNKYTKDLEKAEELLIEDGWTLNENGQDYVKGTDTVRYKQVDGELMGLKIRWAKMEDSVAADLIEEVLPEAVAEIGMEIEITEVPFLELLEQYYRHGDREYDMIYLATNFISIFDPYFVFHTDDAYQGTQNTTGFRDEHLEELAKDMRETEPGALLEYAQKWLTFQEYWNEKLPMLPLYSNIYFDFFVPELNNYHPDAEMNWPVAIVYSYLGDEKPEWLVEMEAQQAEDVMLGPDGEPVEVEMLEDE